MKVFNAKQNVGTKEQPRWEYRGTVIIRDSGNSGVLFLRTGQNGPDGKPVQVEITLFAKRAKAPQVGEGASAAAAAMVH